MASLFRRITQALIVVALLALAACSNTSPVPSQQSANASDEGAAGPDGFVGDSAVDVGTTDAPADDAAPSIGADEVTNSLPAALPMADDDPAASGSLPRTTIDGILLTADETEFDYGDGPEASIEIDAEHSGGLAGLFLPTRKLVSDTETANVLGWAGSNETYVFVLETGPSVQLVQVTTEAGLVDQTAPNAGQLAVVGARVADSDQLRIDAIDSSGNVVATCAYDDLFLICS